MGIWRARTPIGRWLWGRHRPGSLIVILTVLMAALTVPAFAATQTPADGWDPPSTPLGPQTKSVKGKDLKPEALKGAQLPALEKWQPHQAVTLPGTATVTVGAAGSAAAAARSATGGAAPASGGGQLAQAGRLPVSLGAADGTAGVTRDVRVEVSDAAKGKAAGLQMPLVTLTGSDAPAGLTENRVRVALDLNALTGQLWADRARLVLLPACALTTPEKPDCRKQTPVASTVDVSKGTISAEITLPTGGTATSADPSTAGRLAPMTAAPSGASVFLSAAPAPGGAGGNYAATSLNPSAAWAAGSNVGNFTYAYPIQVPPSLSGAAPAVSLSYDSSSVDGKTSAQNSQASWIGDGWGYEPGFIERSYKSCDKAGITGSGDLCWGGQNATMSLAGHSGTLVLDDTTGVWHLQNDDGTKIEKLSGASNNLPTGEYWRVTTTDGTQYWFGNNHLPGGDGTDPAANSTLDEPVYSPNSGDPCYQAATDKGSWCQMGWRWNLDYVVDPHKNLMTYGYDLPETNKYVRGGAQNSGNGTLTAYARGSYLKQIGYGQRLPEQIAAKGTLKPAATVSFTTAERCFASGSITCAESQRTSANMTFWPDVPLDQFCDGTTTCNNYSPTFFTTKRLTGITTQVLSGTSYVPVDSWALNQSFAQPGDGTAPALWLDSIVRTGSTGGASTPLPPVTFKGRELPNRVDGNLTLKDGSKVAVPQFNRPRLQQITTETGGQINVVYATTADPNDPLRPACSRVAGTMPSSEDGNKLACSPVKWYLPGSSSPDPVNDWFSKYLVTAVTEQDAITGASLVKSTNYTYNGDAAWHRNDAEFADPKTRTWDNFRGYGSVTTTTGSGFAGEAPKTQATTTYLRGMFGDLKADGKTTRTDTVHNPLGGDVQDSEWLAGTVLASETYDKAGSGGTVVGRTATTTNEQGKTATHHQSGGMPDLIARSAPSQTTSVNAAKLANGTWRTTTTVRVTDPAKGNRLVHVDDKGDGTSATPEICTTTDYAGSTNPMLITAVSEQTSVVGPCGTTANAANTISDTRTLFDGLAFGQAGDLAEPTSSQVLDHYDGNGEPVFLHTGTITYDVYGRPSTAGTTDGSTYGRDGARLSDANTAVATTRTDYTPASGALPTQIKTTTPLGWTSTVTQDPGRALALTSTDANGRTTTEKYDGLGRLSEVWTPDRATDLSASIQYTYSINGVTAPTVVTTRTLRETLPGSNNFSWKKELYDGLGRLRQTQSTLSTGGAGRLLADTFYDSHGWVTRTSSPYYDSARLPDDTVFLVPDGEVPAQTWNTYDGLGRVTGTEFRSYAQPQWATTTSYPGADRTDVTPPQGAAPTSTFTDARGRTSALWQYRTANPTGNPADADVTSYTYTPSGQPAGRKDSAGNTWTYGYDQRGRQISATDPDTGTGRTYYDIKSQVDHTVDANGNTLAYSYDLLGRKTGMYAGSVSDANQLAGWTFDSLPGAKGQPVASTRYVHDSGKTLAYTQGVTGYDITYRPLGTSVTIPQEEKELAGTYTTSNTYNPVLGTLAKTTMSAVGGLPAETVGYHYTDTGVLWDSAGNDPLVTRVIYDAFGRPTRTDVGVASYQKVVSTQQYDEATGRVINSWVDRQTDPKASVDHTSYTYNLSGAITSVSNVQGGTATDTQCFTYDYLGRLTSAWTDTAGTTTRPTGQWNDSSGAVNGSGSSASVPGIGGCVNANGPAVSGSPARPSVGGPAPYWQDYTYDSTGNRTGLNQHAITSPPTLDPSQTTQVAMASDSTQTWTVALSGGKVWTSRQNGDGSWPLFDDLTAQAGPLTGIDSVSAAVSNGQLQVMAIAGGKLWHTVRRADGSWQAWGDVFSVVGPLSQPSKLALTATASGLEVLTTSGGKVWHTVRKPDGNWQTQGWGDVYSVVGALNAPSQIAASATGSGLEIMVYDGGKLWHTVRRPDGTWQVQGWGDVYSVVGPLTGIGQFALAGVGSGLQAVALAQGKPWHVSRNSAGSWTTWTDVNTSAGQVATPTTVGIAGSGNDLKVVLAGSGQLNYATHNETAHTWSAWQRVNTAAGPGAPGSTTAQTFRPAGSVNTKTDAPNTGGGTGGPHALLTSAVTTASGTKTSSYQYDAAGNTTAVTDTSGTTTLTWTGEDKLDSVKRTGEAQGTSYLYDADGNQLIRRNPGKVTLNLGADEVTLDTNTRALSDVRYYGAPGGITITRVTAPGGGKLVYQVSDPHGTNGVQITSDASQVVTRRPTDPFGNPRGTQPDPSTWAGDKGFVGGTKDDATGLTNLGAREYQPTTGRFLNPDPILDSASPQQWNGYAYSNNNPVNLSDPSGQHFEECGNGMYACKGGIDPVSEGPKYNEIVADIKHGIDAARERRAAASSKSNGSGKAKTLLNFLHDAWGSFSQKAVDVGKGAWNLEARAGSDVYHCFGGSWNSCTDYGKIIWQGSPIINSEANAGVVLGLGSDSKEIYDNYADGNSGVATGQLAFLALQLAGGGEGAEARGGLRAAEGASLLDRLKEFFAKCNSFPAGTLVLLAGGTAKPIDQLAEGDLVAASDPQTGTTATRPITNTIVTPDDQDFTDLTITAEGTTTEAKPLTSTQHHPYWDATNSRWTNAADLQPGDRLRSSDGSTVTVESVRNYQLAPTTAYNLTVADLHTYYVLAGATPVLVHNCDIPMDEAVKRAVAHVGDNATVVRSGSGGVQFMSVTTDEAGNAVRKIARFDVNPNSAHVQKLGPHLNLETQINGRTVTSGPLKDPHTPIDPFTIRPGDYWP
ncbi:polymorphic toxin-type HINT domain-containing protein [Kitasatospora sp. NPDC049258]|uniref:polymorphic toxin-type HINT domain-containing protein n=1 Tax=Kitasatospora sp. NPDC049258 TaxID=3155394 RepID=UPI003426D04A